MAPARGHELGAARTARLRRALNATGVIVHTNLGRAPLADAALERVREVGRGYSNLEYDLSAGTRGSRQDHVAGILRRLTGAEAALALEPRCGCVRVDGAQPLEVERAAEPDERGRLASRQSVAAEADGSRAGERGSRRRGGERSVDR